MTTVDTATSSPAALVTTEWAREHLDDDRVRFLEVDVDVPIETGEGSSN